MSQTQIIGDDFWPDKMTRSGETATRQQMEAAWGAWSGGRGHDLIKRLRHAGAGDGRAWSCSRLADAMLQKARKAGLVKFECGKWVKEGQTDG